MKHQITVTDIESSNIKRVFVCDSAKDAKWLGKKLVKTVNANHYKVDQWIDHGNGTKERWIKEF